MHSGKSANLIFASMRSERGRLRLTRPAWRRVFFAGTLVPCLAHSDGVTRRLVNLRMVGSLFFVIGLVINGIFSFASDSGTAYVVINGVAFLIYVLVANNVYTARQ